jgi:hypothetical protein
VLPDFEHRLIDTTIRIGKLFARHEKLPIPRRIDPASTPQLAQFRAHGVAGSPLRSAAIRRDLGPGFGHVRRRACSHLAPSRAEPAASWNARRTGEPSEFG